MLERCCAVSIDSVGEGNRKLSIGKGGWFGWGRSMSREGASLRREMGFVDLNLNLASGAKLKNSNLEENAARVHVVIDGSGLKKVISFSPTWT